MSIITGLSRRRTPTSRRRTPTTRCSLWRHQPVWTSPLSSICRTTISRPLRSTRSGRALCSWAQRASGRALWGLWGSASGRILWTPRPCRYVQVVEQLRKLELPGNEQACFGCKETIERLLLCFFIFSPPFSLTLRCNDG